MGDPEVGLRLAGALWRFWAEREHWHEGLDWLTALLTPSGEGSRTVHCAKALMVAGHLATNAWGWESQRAIRLLEEIQTLCAAVPERVQPAEASAAARPVKAGDVPVVNFDTIEHLRQLGSSVAFVEKLIRVFIADNSTLLVKVEQTLAARNYHELRSLLHAMKGSSASMGTDRLTRTCSSFGTLSDAELRLQAPALLRTLNEELGAARAQLERYLLERRKSAS